MQQPIRRYIFNKLAFAYTIVIIIVTIVSIGFYYNTSVKAYHEKYNNQIDNFQWALSEWLDAGKRELSYLKDSYTGGTLPIKAQHEALQQLWLTKQNRFDYIFVVDKNGDYMTSKNPDSKNVKDRVYYQNAMSGKTYVSEMLISRLTNNDMMVIAMPLTSRENQRIGVFAGAIEVGNLTRQMQAFTLGDDNVKAYIVDKEGKVASVVQRGIRTNKESLLGADINEIVGKDVLQQSFGEPFAISRGFALHRNITGSDNWHVVFTVDDSKLYEGMFLQLIIILSISSLLLLAVSKLSQGIARDIVEPIHGLIESFADSDRGQEACDRPTLQLMELDLLYNAYHDSKRALYDLTYTDSLTGLNNLTYFKKWLQESLYRRKAELVERNLLVFMEIDHFKVINDTFGFKGGDFVIRYIASWLSHQPDVIKPSKMNGDEFACIVAHELGILRVYALRDELNDYLAKGIYYEGSYIHVTVSFGVSHFYEEDNDAEICFQNAYIALNEAKSAAIAGLEVYNQRLKSQVTRRVLLEMSMREALGAGEMYPVYQPIVGVDASGETQLAGVEALIRWESPSLGFVSPSEFIPIAENSRFIVDIGRWMIEKTLSDLTHMKAQGGESIYLSLNAASAEFEQPDFADFLLEAIRVNGHSEADIIVELTERVMMGDRPEVEYNIKKLIDSGVRLSLDDFGTGYSSLSYLLKYPFSVVKIDRSFIVNGHEKSSQDLLKVMRLIAEKYSLKTVAEGVETEDHAQMVSSIGFDFSQGYYFSKPFKLEALPNFLERHKIVPLYTAENGIYNRREKN